MKSNPNLILAWLWILLFLPLTQSGCSSPGKTTQSGWAVPPRAENPVTRDLAASRNQETVAVVFLPPPEFFYESPLPKSEAARELVGDPVQFSAGPYDPVSVGLLPVVLGVEATLGLVKGVSVEKTSAAAAVITNVIADFSLADRLCRTFTNAAVGKTGQTFAVIRAEGTVEPVRHFTTEDNFSRRANTSGVKSSLVFGGNRILYPALAERGISNVFAIQLLQYGLEFRPTKMANDDPPAANVNARLTLILVVEGWLIHDGNIVRCRHVEFAGPRRRFLAWAAHDGQALRQALENALPIVAADLMERTFVHPDEYSQDP